MARGGGPTLKRRLTPVLTPVKAIFYTFVHLNREERQCRKEAGKYGISGVFDWCTGKARINLQSAALATWLRRLVSNCINQQVG
jgi:hypothetical protein